VTALQPVIDSGDFSEPKSVQETTGRFWRAMDSFEAFVDECLVIQAGASVTGATAYLRYREFCDENGHKNRLGRNRFLEKLRVLDGVRQHTAGMREYQNVRLADPLPFEEGAA
jgi:phage/plasmid-associated DNA primase